MFAERFRMVRFIYNSTQRGPDLPVQNSKQKRVKRYCGPRQQHDKNNRKRPFRLDMDSQTGDLKFGLTHRPAPTYLAGLSDFTQLASPQY
jgi:hypothetical protein